jgi:hypothetical protein
MPDNSILNSDSGTSSTSLVCWITRFNRWKNESAPDKGLLEGKRTNWRHVWRRALFYSRGSNSGLLWKSLPCWSSPKVIRRSRSFVWIVTSGHPFSAVDAMGRPRTVWYKSCLLDNKQMDSSLHKINRRSKTGNGHLMLDRETDEKFPD